MITWDYSCLSTFLRNFHFNSTRHKNKSVSIYECRVPGVECVLFYRPDWPFPWDVFAGSVGYGWGTWDICLRLLDNQPDGLTEATKKEETMVVPTKHFKRSSKKIYKHPTMQFRKHRGEKPHGVDIQKRTKPCGSKYRVTCRSKETPG